MKKFKIKSEIRETNEKKIHLCAVEKMPTCHMLPTPVIANDDKIIKLKQM